MKVLIYWKENDLKPTGGPRGYLYNLRRELQKNNITGIDFINIDEKIGLKQKIISKIKEKYNTLPKKVKLKIPVYKRMIFKRAFGNIPRKSIVDLNDYDIVHFHQAMTMYMVKDSLEKFNGKVVFTTHCPIVSYKEILSSMISEKKYKKNEPKYDRLDVFDEYAFNRADYILFPVKEAEECYYNTWNKYKEIHDRNREKYYYIPTGIEPVKIKESSSVIREKYNIPKNAFVISFVGRHNEIKGYYNLKFIGEEILKKNKNVYFLVAGKEAPLKGLNDDRWIEVGWTNDPHSIINSADLFILPNKETYFDLILLEVLSIGTPILMTETGGNKYFKKYNLESLMFYKDNLEAIDIINKFVNTDDEYRKKLRELNKQLFLNNFTTQIFLKNYLEMLNNIESRIKK